MGLDQSLYREVQLKGKMEITDKKLDEVLGGEKMRPSVRHEVCYWRKFNALHKYFDDHFNEQDNDNCVDMYMGIEDIKKLLLLVKKIRKRVRLGNGFVSRYSSVENKDKLKGHKIGDEVYDEVSKIRELGDEIKSVVITQEFDDIFYLDFRVDGKVILNPEVCGGLPTEEGFFFGDTDYNEYYVADLDSTIEQLEKVIDEHKKLIKAGVAEYDIDYYYRAWY